MSSDPWRSLSVPVGAEAASARRVDAAGRWNFFWAKDVAGRYLLLLEYQGLLEAVPSLPRLHGIGLTDSKSCRALRRRSKISGMN